MTVAANGTLQITGTAVRALSGSLNNQGLIVGSGLNVIYLANGRLTNLVGGMFEIQNNQNIYTSSGTPIIVNAGTIRKSRGGRVSTIVVPLINSGALDVQSGQISYWGGSQFNSGTAFTGPGTSAVYTGPVTFTGAITSGNLEIASDGTLNLAGTHTLSGTVRWTGGRPPAPLAGETAACARCHPVGTEGASAPDLRWASLAQDAAPASGLRPRSAYAERSFARAGTVGVDPRGAPLAASMPRYSLSRAEMDALIAYLRTL